MIYSSYPPNSLTQVLSDGTDTYLYGVGRIAQQQGSQKEYFLADALGSVRQLADNTSVTLSESYQPYGEQLSSEGTGVSSYGYTGEATDTIGLVYLRSRYYAPYLNQFIQADTIVPDYTYPQSLNRYSYVWNSPINYTDPSGYRPCGEECGGPPLITQRALVIFEKDPIDPQDWTIDEKDVIDEQAERSANRYASVINNYRKWVKFWAWKACDSEVYNSYVTPYDVFVRIHQGRVHFLRSSSTPGKAGYTTASNRITIYNIKGVNNYIVSHPRLITHELGHAFDMGTAGGVYTDFRDNLLRADPSAHTDPNGRWFGFAGGWEVWQFGMANSTSEVFADMYIGWVYSNIWDIRDPLDPNDQGILRQNFMSLTMTRLLVAYTDDIQ